MWHNLYYLTIDEISLYFYEVFYSMHYLFQSNSLVDGTSYHDLDHLYKSNYYFRNIAKDVLLFLQTEALSFQTQVENQSFTYESIPNMN